jgi:hypothetical protein
MAIALNLTAPLKQDPESQQRIQQLRAIFAEQVQPALEAALARSETVHFARVLVIDNRYIQILTEFDGDPMQYTEFFRKDLGKVFELVFSLVDGAPPWADLNDPNAFYEYTSGLNLKALGSSATGDGRGYLFCAYGDATVREIKAGLDQSAARTA